MKALKILKGRVVHYLRHGAAPCGISYDRAKLFRVPANWPDGHAWSDRWEYVDCAGCRALAFVGAEAAK